MPRSKRRSKRRSSRRSFNPSKCSVPRVWCGKGVKPRRRSNESYYSRKGKNYECLQQGIGAGLNQERRKSVPAASLKNIKYIGEVYEASFRRRNIRTLAQLARYARDNPVRLDDMLRRVLTRKNIDVLDERAYNSVLLFLYNRGIVDLPDCIRM